MGATALGGSSARVRSPLAEKSSVILAAQEVSLFSSRSCCCVSRSLAHFLESGARRCDAILAHFFRRGVCLKRAASPPPSSISFLSKPQSSPLATAFFLGGEK